MNNNCNYSIYWKYIDIFDNTLNRQRHSHKHIFMLYLDYSHSYYLHFLSWHWSVFQNYSCMSSLLTFNKISFLTSQKGDCIAGVAYLKVKNHVTCWKTIIPEKSTLPKTFCFQKARLQIYVTKIIRPPDFLCVFTRTSETDFPAKKKYRKPEFREKRKITCLVGMFSFLIVILNNFSLLYYFDFNLWCAILLQVTLYWF